MPNLYVRATALPNICGRIDYVASAHRQEHLLASYDGAADLLDGQFWQQLAKESRAAFEQFGTKTRDGKELKCCEGRELMIQLSNALLDRMTPDEIVKTVAEAFQTKLGVPVAIGLHQKSKTAAQNNLHVHVILPERELLENPEVKIADRNLFFDADGKRRYKKSEILDENKQLLPGCRIVKKGEIYEQRYFSSVDKSRSSKAWLKDIKTNVVLPLRNGSLKGDVEITEFDKATGKLPQQHVGKVAYVESDEAEKTTAKIQDYNEQVREYNRTVDAGLPEETKKKAQQAVWNTSNRNGMLHAVIIQIRNILLKFLGMKDQEIEELDRPDFKSISIAELMMKAIKLEKQRKAQQELEGQTEGRRIVVARSDKMEDLAEAAEMARQINEIKRDFEREKAAERKIEPDAR